MVYNIIHAKRNKIEFTPFRYEYQVTSDQNGSGRNFPQTESSDSYYKDEEEYAEYSDNDTKEGLENNEYYVETGTEYYEKPGSPVNNLKYSKWKRFGATIDRQFGILTGIFNIRGIEVCSNHSNLGARKCNIWLLMYCVFDLQKNMFQGFLDTIFQIAPVVVPAATLSLGGLNFFHNVNQQEVLDQHQDSLDSLTTALASLTSRVTALESSAGASGASAGKFIIIDQGPLLN